MYHIEDRMYIFKYYFSRKSLYEFHSNVCTVKNPVAFTINTRNWLPAPLPSFFTGIRWTFQELPRTMGKAV